MEQISGLYKHYKGNVYRVLYVVKHSETLEDMVIYQDVTDDSKIWARPASMWNEIVLVDGKEILRFQKL